MVVLDRVPGFGVLKTASNEVRKRSAKSLVITLIFTFFPQILAGYIIGISANQSKILGAKVFEPLISHGEIFLYSLALVAPVYTLIWRDAALHDRFWLGLYAGIITTLSSATFEVVLINLKSVNNLALIIVSIILTTATVTLLYVTDIIEQLDSASVAKAIERSNQDAVSEIQAGLNG